MSSFIELRNQKPSHIGQTNGWYLEVNVGGCSKWLEILGLLLGVKGMCQAVLPDLFDLKPPTRSLKNLPTIELCKVFLK